MGAGWSKLSPAEIDVFDEHEPSGKQTLLGDAGFFSGYAEVSVSPGQTIQTSQATTEASSSIPMFQGADQYGVAVGGEIELSELEVRELEEHDGFEDHHPISSKPHSPTMSPASPIQAFLKPPEIAQLNSRRHSENLVSFSKLPQSSPPPIQRAFVDLEETEEEEEEEEAHKEVQEFPECPSSSQLSLLPLTGLFELEKAQEQQNPSSSMSQFSDPFEPGDHDPEEPPAHLAPTLKSSDNEEMKIEAAESALNGNLSQPLPSAQKLLFFDLDRKRKAPAGLVTLAGDYIAAAASRNKLNPPHQTCSLERHTPCKLMTSPGLFGTKSCEENARMELQGMGTVPTVVGNTYIEKAIGNHHNIPHEAAALISTYSSSLPTYQIKYDDGKEVQLPLDWNGLEPCLVDITKQEDSVTVEKRNGAASKKKKGPKTGLRFKNVGDLVYNTRIKSRGRRRRKT